MLESGLVPVLIGVNLKQYNKNSFIADRTKGSAKWPYLALRMVAKDNEEAIAVYPRGFPHRQLFFECLHEWEWVNQFTYNT